MARARPPRSCPATRDTLYSDAPNEAPPLNLQKYGPTVSAQDVRLNRHTNLISVEIAVSPRRPRRDEAEKDVAHELIRELRAGEVFARHRRKVGHGIYGDVVEQGLAE